MSRGVVFIDRDGGLIVRPPDGNVTLQNLRLLPDVVPALKALRQAGYELVMVAKHDGATEFLRELFASQGAPFESVVAVSDGMLLLFPSWLQHSVDPNASARNRISVSFNLMFTEYGELCKPLWEGGSSR